MTLESASQIKILQAKCVPCTVHSICLCVCLKGKKRDKIYCISISEIHSRCLNNPLSDYMRVLHAYVEVEHYIFFQEYIYLYTVYGLYIEVYVFVSLTM